MKYFLEKRTKLRKLQTLTCLWFVFISCSSIEAQVENAGFAENQFGDSIHDSAVVRADFQNDARRLENDPHNFSLATTSASTELAADIHEPITNSSWLGYVKRQSQKLDLVKVISSLAIVLGGYFGFVWLVRSMNPNATQGLPQEVVEVLGQSTFGPRKMLQLVRLGSKLLLLMHHNDGIQTIGEITDPHEVEYLVSLCGGKKVNQSAIAIRKASTSTTNKTGSADLNHVLQQLQRSAENKSGAVFDA
ncbi:MAG: flagellar biosynthetic protein FliO [Planctomycetota bacterium]